jgi:uncharacterized membrane protein YphA (DoxX/SURF4 family)
VAEPERTSRSRWVAAFHRIPPIEFLRIGAGLVWVANLVFILDPTNHYWSTFSSTASSFAPTTVGGPGLAEYVAAHPLIFAWAIALFTGYLSVAFLLGFTTRSAALLGSCFSAVLLATQFGSTFLFPGGTDVGAHPLYILIYIVLILGGAGRAFSVDHLLRAWWVERKARRAPRGAPVPHPWATAVPPRTLFAYAVAGILVSFAVGLGLVVVLPVAPGTAGTGATGPVHYVNLTVDLNSSNGWPQYLPANFSVPTGVAVFTIVDRDLPMNWSGCDCTVHGTVGGTELLNNSTVRIVPSSNVAHTFTIPTIGLNVLSPGNSTIEFRVVLPGPGTYTWYCLAPCGAGGNPYATGPMGIPGFMTGTMTVTS